MATWPVGLPEFVLVNGFRRSPNSNVISFGTEVGPGKTRRRSTARTKNMAASLMVDGTQLATFEAFFEDDLVDGSLPFDWVDPVGGAACTFRFDPASPYSVSAVSGNDVWTVTMSIIKQP